MDRTRRWTVENFKLPAAILFGVTGLLAIPACSSGPSDETESSQDEARSCPVYSPPLCAQGESIKVVTNADGCDVPTCAPNE